MPDFHAPKRIASRLVSVSIAILLLVIVTNAYTVIMHGGRQIEIPSKFVVTPATLTYEVAEGIQITIAMAAIDIPATEKANREVPGSLLARAKREATLSSGSNDDLKKPNASSGARRTITNRDLETLRRKRLESDTEYESRRKQLGLPSMEEQRKLAAAQFDAVTTELALNRISKLESEHYWRGRAAALRTEMSALDAELSYLRRTLDGGSFGTPYGGFGRSFTSIGSIGGIGFRGTGTFGSFAGGRSFHGQSSHRSNVSLAPTYGSPIRGRVGFGGGATRGRVLVSPGNSRHSRQIGGGAHFGVLPNATVFGYPSQGYDFTYDRGGLITRFNDLGAARAGLNARWRELEDEARRAGVAPGWLRP